jgi:chorismate dehydratase
MDRQPILNIGGVSFLNAKPLLFGLENQPDLRLRLDVPAKLLPGLESKKLDAALLPTIDYQRMTGLRIIPAGGIGSDGETLTVRIFSKNPIEKIEELACDPDSHTSVALARITLAERFGILPEFTANVRDCAATLLIGDKVVTQAPLDRPYQLDLGHAWKELTGLPFVFAVWTARADVDLRDLPARLEESRRRGMLAIDQIVKDFAIPLGWPADLATKYLSQNLQFEIGPKQLEAMRLFYQLAAKHKLIESARELQL